MSELQIFGKMYVAGLQNVREPFYLNRLPWPISSHFAAERLCIMSGRRA